MTRNKQSKTNSKSTGGNSSNSKSGGILRFKPPKPSNESIKAKFFEADDTEVSEQIRSYQPGDDHANLVALMGRIVGLGDMYNLWVDGKAQKLAQTMSRALEDQVREEWQIITSEVNNWEQEDMKTRFTQLLQRLGQQVFGPTAFKMQCRAMENGEIKIPERELRAGAYRMFQINRALTYLGIYAREYTVEELNKIIVKSLPPLAMRKYIENGGDDLEDQADILELMTQLDTKFRLKKQFQEQENKASGNNNNSGGKSNNQSGKNGSSGNGGKKPSNPCRKHDGAHEWKDCPDNSNNKEKSQSKSKGDKETKGNKNSKGDLHSTNSSSSKKTSPAVRISNTSRTVEYDADLQHSDDESALMVQAVNVDAPAVNAITVIEVPAADGTHLGTTVLIDNGFTSHMMMTHAFALDLGYEFQPREARGTGAYNTAGGEMTPLHQVTVQDMRLPHLSPHRAFTGTIEIAPESAGDFGYGVVIGIKMMDLLQLDTSRTTKEIIWGDIRVPMVLPGYWTDKRIRSLLTDGTVTANVVPEPTPTSDEVIEEFFATTSTYTEAVYEKPDLAVIIQRDGQHLTPEQQAQLLQVLVNNEIVFQGCRGEYTGGEVGITLKEDAIPFRAKPYPVQLKNREIMEEEFRRQCTIGAMRRLSPKEFEARVWAFPAFGIPKKNGTIRVVIDFRRLNSQLVRREFPLSTTEEILTSIQGFMYATSLDLNMGYLSIPLNDHAREILTIIMPFGAYECLALPMGVMTATDLFQARMVHLFADMEERRPHPYIDDILHFKGVTFDEHLSVLDEMLKLLAFAGMQVSADKSRFCQTSVEFLGFQLDRTGYRPLPSRVDAIMRVLPPSNLKQVRGFLGVINFIKNHIPNRAAIIEPITRLTRKGEKFIWGDEQQRAFEKVKAIISESIMLTYPNPNRPFDIYPDASSTYAMGALLMQDGNVISTFSRKFNEAQLKYTITGQELLAAAEACKHFAQIIRGCEIHIHTDHQNLTYDDTVHVNLREQRTRIFLDEEFAPTFVHIKGTNNTGADGLSRLPMSDDVPATAKEHLFAINNIDPTINEDFPLDMKQISFAQAADEILQRRIKSGKYDDKLGKNEIDGRIVITFNGKVWVPKSLQQRIVAWYHDNLQHAGVTCLVNSISQTFAWKGLRTMVEEHVATCDSCQRNKVSNKKQYGKLPVVSALRNKNPWEKVQVDCAGPWTIRYNNQLTGKISTFQIFLMSMVDVGSNWCEFARIQSANSIATAKAFDKNWLCRYPRPKECGHDNGNEFLGREFQEMLESYGVISKPTTVKNPTANSIVERIHGTLGEQLRSTIFEMDWSEDVDTLVQACAYALRATAPSQGIYSPAQLAFGCDMIFRQKVLIDWERLKATRDKQALQNNAKENKKRLEHEYKVGDKVLIILKPYERRNNPKISAPTSMEGPHTILAVHANGNVKLQRGAYTEIMSICRIMPYNSREQ